MMSKYPECERWSAVEEQVRAIREFLEWLRTEEIALSRADEKTGGPPPCWHLPIHESYDALLARYFAIDSTALETERRAILQEAAKFAGGE